MIRGGTEALNFLMGVISNRREKFTLLGLQGDNPYPHQFPPLMVHPDFHIKKTLSKVLDLLTVIILK